jgi:hypothetical protein
MTNTRSVHHPTKWGPSGIRTLLLLLVPRSFLIA